MLPAFQNRQSCPPGACICGREGLLDNPAADLRFLRLTRPEEKRLLERLENLNSLAELERIQQRLAEQLGTHLQGKRPARPPFARTPRPASCAFSSRGFIWKRCTRGARPGLGTSRPGGAAG